MERRRRIRRRAAVASKLSAQALVAMRLAISWVLSCPHKYSTGLSSGGVSGQPFDHDASLGGSDMVFDQGAAMDRSAIPEDQHFPSDMALEVSEEFDHLRALDAAGMDLEIEAPEGQAPDDRKTFPVEGFVQ